MAPSSSSRKHRTVGLIEIQSQSLSGSPLTRKFGSSIHSHLSSHLKGHAEAVKGSSSESSSSSQRSSGLKVTQSQSLVGLSNCKKSGSFSHSHAGSHLKGHSVNASGSRPHRFKGFSLIHAQVLLGLPLAMKDVLSSHCASARETA